MQSVVKIVFIMLHRNYISDDNRVRAQNQVIDETPEHAGDFKEW